MRSQTSAVKVSTSLLSPGIGSTTATAMLARTSRRCLFDSKWRKTLPSHATRASVSTVSHTTESGNVPEPLVTSAVHTDQSRLSRKRCAPPPPPKNATRAPLASADASSDGTLSESVRQLLPLLRAQGPHYITAHIHAFPYLLTQGDTLRLPFRLPSVNPGDVIRLNRASVIGSRDFTLKAGEMPPKSVLYKGMKGEPVPAKERRKWIDERLFVCRATVLGVESEPMRIMEKTKRRQRHVKTVKSKHRYTVLRISEVKINSVEEIEAGKDESMLSRSVENDVDAGDLDMAELRAKMEKLQSRRDEAKKKLLR
ncbi:hypothetical protein K402DRAFT_371453 [Aulographum hederae CBS 113979]|uniref:Large ribosomal subunit protein bL21m n=1 Tax=Aulographum hederae CBS 113979 TaxID=1176131 RepID=A0A6G1H8Y2_9PEZI|nr:hypothetical protein K402DRAFT_371453 [Aulographum hederae CBS 113979]